MRIFDLIVMGFKNLFRRKTRTILTVLGVVIGTAAIVVMVSLGIGMNVSFEEQLKQMGSLNRINVTKYIRHQEGNVSVSSSSNRIVLDDKVCTKIKDIKGVKAVTPVVESFVKIVSGKYVADVPIMGIDPDCMEYFDYTVAQGRLLQEGDNDLILFGGTTPQNFYNPKTMGGDMGMGMGMMMGPNGNAKPPVDVMTDKLEITFDMSYGAKKTFTTDPTDKKNKPPKLYKIKAVGVLGQSNGEGDWYCFMNRTYLQKIVKDSNKYQSENSDSPRNNLRNQDNGYERIIVIVDDIKDVDRIQKQIDEMGYGTDSLADIRKSMQKQSQTIQLVLGGIGAVSLLISALGITNTMIMSIYERTREIGVMKVLGCKMKNIKQLFLLESGVIGLLGGIIGVILSYLASLVLNSISGNVFGGGGMGPEGQSKLSVIPIWLALLSIVFAVFIGLISGFSPARRAMKLSALEAIKTE